MFNIEEVSVKRGSGEFSFTTVRGQDSLQEEFSFGYLTEEIEYAIESITKKGDADDVFRAGLERVKDIDTSTMSGKTEKDFKRDVMLMFCAKCVKKYEE